MPQHPNTLILSTVSVYKDRADYQAQNDNQQPPPFDISKPVKMWNTADVSSRTSLGFWRNLEAANTPEYSTLSLTGDELKSVNIPGRYHYQPWSPAPTSATAIGGDGTLFPLSPRVLSTSSQSAVIAEELRLAGYEVTARISDMPINYGTETRRVFELVVDGVPRLVAALLAERYKNGIGTPGSWQPKKPGEETNPRWIPVTPLIEHPYGHPQFGAVIPPPQRLLAEDEEWHRLGIGGVWQVWKKDEWAAHAGTVSGSGGVGGADVKAIMAKLDAIEAGLKKVMASLLLP